METARRHHLFGCPQVQYVVFASPKSGTQWLQALLSAHPQVHCDETRAFGRYFDANHVSGVNITLETYASILRGYHRPPVASDGADDYFRLLTFNLLDTIARTSLLESGKPIYGEKITPLLGTASSVVDCLAEYNPELRFVHLTRDGRDVVVSGLVHQQIIHDPTNGTRGRTLASAVAGRRVPQEMLEFFTALWTQAVNAGLTAARRFEHALQVRYEDLLADEHGQTRRLLQFIGADADDGVVDHCVETASFARMSGGRRRGEEDLASVVRKGVAGDWRNWFTDEQAAWFDDQGGALLAKFGYTRFEGEPGARPAVEDAAPAHGRP